MEITTIVAEHTPETAAQLLIALATEHGGHDNVTVQIARIGDADGGSGVGATAKPSPGIESAETSAHIELSAQGNEPLGPGQSTSAATEASADAGELEARVLRRRRQAVVVLAVLLGGIAALTLLWRIYSVTTSLPTEPPAGRHGAESVPVPSKSPRAATMPGKENP
jgi:hypothetical protein